MKPQLYKLRKQSKRVASLFSAIALGVSSQLPIPQAVQAQVSGVSVGSPSFTILDDGCVQTIPDLGPNSGDTITVATNLTNTTGTNQAFRVVFRAISTRGGTTRTLSEDLLYGGPTYMNRTPSVGGANWDDSYGQVTNTPIIANGGSYTVRANFGLNVQQLINALGLASGQSTPINFRVEVFSSDFSTYYGTAATSQSVIYRSSSDCGGNRATKPGNTSSVLLTANKTVYATTDTITIENSTMGANDTTTTPSTTTGAQLPSWGDTFNDIVDIVRLDVPPTGDPETDYANNSTNIATTLSSWTPNYTLNSGAAADSSISSSFYYSKVVGSSLTANTNFASFSANTLINNKYYLVRLRPRLGGGTNANAGSSSHPVQRAQWTYFAVGTPAPIGAPQADLVTTKTGPTTALAGSTVTYTLTTINNGPNAASNVVVSDNIGTGLTNVVASNGGVYNSTTGIVTFPAVPSLANGAALPYTVSVTAPASGTLTDIVSSTSSTSDPTPANNNGTAANAQVTTTVTPSADLVTTKTGPTTAVAGSTVTYNLTTVNNGPSTATNVVVSDNIGTGLTGVTASNGGIYNSSTGIVTFPAVASLANGEILKYTVSLTASANGGTLTDIVSSTSSTSDPTPTNNNGTAANAQVTTTVTPSADLSINKTDGQMTVTPGSPITYTITVTNNGPSSVTGAAIADTVPSSITGVTWTCSASSGSSCSAVNGTGNAINTAVNLLSGGTATYTVKGTVSPSATGSLINTANVAVPSGVTDPNINNNRSTDENTLTPTADLSINKTDNQTSVAPGSSVVYTITVTNNGPSTLSSVTVTDALPAVIQNPVFTTTTGTYNSSTGVWTGLNLASGQSIVLTLSGTISPTATGSVVNTATVAAPTGVTDPNTGNNSSTDTDTVTVTPAQLRLVKRITSINGTDIAGFVDDPNSADDSSAKWPAPTATSLRGAINGGVVRPGDEVEYTIYFLSDGGSDAQNVTFCDLVPKNQTLVPDAFNSVTPASGGTSGSDRSMTASINGTQVSYTNIADGDTGRFYASNTTVPVPVGGKSPQPCPATNTSTNGNGAIVVNLGNIPKAPVSGSSTNSYGFVRFKAKVD
uniref:hypothetical protein n=1 Tax=Trichocoleus desertorum TaxID=1481672 RepID=UPI0025B61654|nr:hypothetical protein [Trichocoleus desertorum]